MKPTFTFQVTLHPAQKCRSSAGSHTILFTHGVSTDGQAIEDIHTDSVGDDDFRVLLEEGEASIVKATEIASRLCGNVDIPYEPTIEDVASVATELRKRAADAARVYHGAVAGYSF